MTTIDTKDLKDGQGGETEINGHHITFWGNPLDRVINVKPKGTDVVIIVRQQGILQNDGRTPLWGRPLLQVKSGIVQGEESIDSFVNALAITQMLVLYIHPLFANPTEVFNLLVTELQAAGEKFDQIDSILEDTNQMVG